MAESALRRDANAASITLTTERTLAPIGKATLPLPAAPGQAVADATRDLAAIRDSAIPALSDAQRGEHAAREHAKQTVQSMLVTAAQRVSAAGPAGAALARELDALVATATALGAFVGAEELLAHVRVASPASAPAAVAAQLDMAAFDARLRGAIAKLHGVDAVTDAGEQGGDLIATEELVAAAGPVWALIEGRPQANLVDTANRADDLRGDLESLQTRLQALRAQAAAFATQLALAGRADAATYATQMFRPAVDALRARYELLGGDAAVEALATTARGNADAADHSLGMFALRQAPIELGVQPAGVDGVKFEAGIASGIVIGAGEAVRDLFVGMVDMVKSAYASTRDMLTGENLDPMLTAALQLLQLVEATPDLLGGVKERWLASSAYAKGHLIGEVVGYVAMTLTLLFASGLETLEVTLAAQGDEIAALAVRLLRGIHAASNPLTLLKPLAGVSKWPAKLLARMKKAFGVEAKVEEEVLSEAELALRRVAKELGEIPVSKLKNSETYYVSRADGDRMRELVAKLPGAELRDYKKGFILRQREGEELKEWYFEYDEYARITGTRQAAMAKTGLPAPNAATIELWGFRGVRTIDGRPSTEWTEAEKLEVAKMKEEHPLIYAGHVGVSIDGGKSIFGLTPKPPEGMPVLDALKSLMRNEAYPAIVKDDTDIFELAAKQAAKRWNTELVKVIELVDTAKKVDVADELARMSKMKPGEHGLGYSFPLGSPEGGQYYRASNGFDENSVRNCATFPEKLGLPIPEPSGTLSKYIPALDDWSREDGPKDFRTKKERP